MTWKVDCDNCDYSKLITDAEDFDSIEERAKAARDTHARFRDHTVSLEDHSVTAEADVVEEGDVE